MKKALIILLGLLYSLSATAQSGEIVGKIDLGQQEVSIILDKNQGCPKKTNPHKKDIFQINENVQLIDLRNGTKSEVYKSGLNDRIFVDKECPNKTDEMSPTEVARYHNLLLDEYLSTGRKMSDFPTTKDFLIDCYKVAINKYPELRSDAEIETIINDIPNLVGVSNQTKVFISYVNGKVNSLNMADNSKSIIISSWGKSYDENLRNYKQINSEAIRSAVPVYIMSHAYWTSIQEVNNGNGSENVSMTSLPNGNTPKPLYDKQDEIMIGDFCGAVVWYSTGPIGSACAGFFFSMLIKQTF